MWPLERVQGLLEEVGILFQALFHVQGGDEENGAGLYIMLVSNLAL